MTKGEQRVNEAEEVKNNNSVLIDFLKDLAEIGERMKEDENI